MKVMKRKLRNKRKEKWRMVWKRWRRRKRSKSVRRLCFGGR